MDISIKNKEELEDSVFPKESVGMVKSSLLYMKLTLTVAVAI